MSALPTRRSGHKFRHGKLKTTVGCWVMRCRSKTSFCHLFYDVVCLQMPPTRDRTKSGRRGRGRRSRRRRSSLWRRNSRGTSICRWRRGANCPKPWSWRRRRSRFGFRIEGRSGRGNIRTMWSCWLSSIIVRWGFWRPGPFSWAIGCGNFFFFVLLSVCVIHVLKISE